MCINLRLKQFLEQENINIKTSAELLEIPYRTWQNYLLGERVPNAETLIKICNVFNVNLNWLLTGKGEMFIFEQNFTLPELELINSYRNCNSISQQAIQSATKILSGNK